MRKENVYTSQVSGGGAPLTLNKYLRWWTLYTPFMRGIECSLDMTHFDTRKVIEEGAKKSEGGELSKILFPHSM